jgi:uncharacterized protein (UPF0333 family)
MMRTVEVLLVIILLGAAYVATSSYIALPSPSTVSPVDLNQLAYTTLQELDSRYDLSSAAFQTNNLTAWGDLQIALAASLPANMVYNLTVYNVNTASNGAPLYSSVASISNAANLVSTDASSYLEASSNVTYISTPQQISTNGSPITLYILNCSDTEGWWITGYTTSSLAQTVYNLLSPYFTNTVMVQNTNQLNQLLSGKSLQGEAVDNAVVINTCGEAVPIPTSFSSPSGLNYTQGYQGGTYAGYDFTLGKMVQLYNWTWVSIVGYPFYYVTNTVSLSGTPNGFGIYGMYQVGSAGLIAFLEGLDNQPYTNNGGWLTGAPPGEVYLTSQAQSLCNYYGLYPSASQTSTRALPLSITGEYNLDVTTYLFDNATVNGVLYNPGAVFRHYVTTNVNGVEVTNYEGGFFALGMTRIPDIRLAALGILCNYQPARYGSLYTAAGSNRLVVLQLGTVGGG